MKQWVPFPEGEYQVERAFLMAPDGTAAEITYAVIEIFSHRTGMRDVKGTGMLRPYRLSEIHEDHETVDLLLNLGSGFAYRITNPSLSAGKVFAPDVTAAVHFRPTRPWESITPDTFEAYWNSASFDSPAE